MYKNKNHITCHHLSLASSLVINTPHGLHKNHITCHHRSLTLTLFINTPLVINNRIQPKTWPFQDLEFNKVMESKTWSQVLSFKTWQQWNLPSFGRNLFSMPRGHGSLATSSTAWLCEEKPISQEAGNLSALFQRLPFCVVRTNIY